MWVIDTDSLIALRRTYSPQFFGPLWTELDQAILRGDLVSTKINFEELKVEEEDELFLHWKNDHEAMFVEPDEATQIKVVEILGRFPDLIDINLDKEQADPYLIALALVLDATVITEEQPLSVQAMADPRRKSKMKIPNVCQHYGVPVIKLVEFINSAEWRRS